MNIHTHALRLLHITSNQDDCQAGKDYLDQHGFHVTSCMKSLDALTLIKQTSFDLIILDLAMPDMEGDALCQAIRLQDETKHTPILIIASLDDAQSIQRAFDAGATDFTVKPIRWVLVSYRIQFLLRATTLAAKLEHIAYYDPLTNLPNRHHLSTLVEDKMEFARRYDMMMALISLDLDNFVRINDTFGHARGDQFLVEVSARLQKTLRKSDLFETSHRGTLTLARVSGDEFTILLPNITQAKEAATVCERLLRELEPPFVIDGHEVVMTASMGISLFPHDGDTLETLLKRADMAMYQCKSQGKNHYQLYDRLMQAQAEEELVLESHLRKAIELDEFAGLLQPQWDIASESITGFELLLRWKSEKLGNIPPNVFIPLAEKCALIHAIGDWVVKKACAYLREFSALGIDSTIAINVSALQLNATDFVSFVKEQVMEYGIEPRKLEIEITETMIMENRTTAITKLEALHAFGFTLAIDDFGTGYSSLAYLKKLPISKVKIDKAFIDELPHCRDDVAVVKAMIALSHNLNFRVIAEGVETQEQLEFLKAQQCDAIQGYYIGKPMTFGDAIGLFQNTPCLSSPLSVCKNRAS